MKTVILAGGFGTRLSEYTDSIPKPMVPIGKKPMIEHIMRTYAKYGHNEFIIALGYKGEIIKKYFENFKENWKINLVDTGAETLTGGRLKRLEKILKNETFFLTYGDGLCDVNINDLLKFHKDNKKTITVTAVRPPARFGSLIIKNSEVVEFNEKVVKGENWINGGYFVVEPGIFKYLSGDKEILEKEPLERLAKMSEFCAYKHNSFWQCMDHKIDKDKLDKMCEKKEMPWLEK
jgi:glucose-1-phosphate cytidylyltransferase